eukprot:10075568-Alexandrium_andersonii.AAC.1
MTAWRMRSIMSRTSVQKRTYCATLASTTRQKPSCLPNNSTPLVAMASAHSLPTRWESVSNPAATCSALAWPLSLVALTASGPL